MNATDDTGMPKTRSVRIAVALLLAIQAVLLYYSSRVNFVTADEPGYFAGGITNWRRGAFDLYRVNPPLPRMLAVLPVLPLDVKVAYRNWFPDMAQARSELYVGRDFVTANGPRYLSFIRIARLSTIVWALLGGWLTFAWTRRLFGIRAGVLALALWCFEPNVLAHGSLMTSDIPATVAGMAALFVFWQFLEQPRWSLALAAGALLGIALLTKFSNFYLLLALPLLALIHRLSGRRASDSTRRRAFARGSHLAAIGGIALLVVNAGYGFHGSFKPLGSLTFLSTSLLDEGLSDRAAPGVMLTGNRFRNGWLGRVRVPIPADYILGVDVQHHDFEHRFHSYLNGQWRDRGWWYYYLYAFALKVPISTIVLILVGLFLLLRDRNIDPISKTAVLLPIVVVSTLVSSQVGFNSHLRYLLPIFPFLMIVAGRVAQCRGRAAGAIIVLLLLSTVTSSMRVYPHSLSYFNELAGGPARGDEHLVDSNIDWGQDLLELKTWLERNASGVPLGLAYFGSADPGIVGLKFRLPRFFQRSAYDTDMGPHPGLFAVSVNFLRGMRFAAPDGLGDWQPVGLQDFGYFTRFRPVASAGYSIRIYCITPAEADAVRSELGLPPLPPSSVPPFDCTRFTR